VKSPDILYSKILYLVVQLLRNDHEMDGYTRVVYGQRLGKHVPAATGRRAAIEVLLETGCFYVVRAEKL
jgi:hypothetical protein